MYLWGVPYLQVLYLWGAPHSQVLFLCTGTVPISSASAGRFCCSLMMRCDNLTWCGNFAGGVSFTWHEQVWIIWYHQPHVFEFVNNKFKVMRLLVPNGVNVQWERRWCSVSQFIGGGGGGEFNKTPHFKWPMKDYHNHQYIKWQSSYIKENIISYHIQSPNIPPHKQIFITINIKSNIKSTLQ